MILNFLQARDLSKLAQVSHYWNQLADDSILWKKLCNKNKIKDSTIYNSTVACNVFNNNEVEKNVYKNLYVSDYNLTLNLKIRPLPKPLVLRGHDDHVFKIRWKSNSKWF